MNIFRVKKLNKNKILSAGSVEVETPNTRPSAPPKLTFSWLIKNPVCMLGFGFGLGLAPKAPGTFGTLLAPPIAWLLLQFSLPVSVLIVVLTAFFVVGVPICSVSEKRSGRADCSGIVWDEIAAMVGVLVVVPFGLVSWVVSFVVFRLFDALKPWPISFFDRRFHGGFGIMLDDLIAAFFTLITIEIINLYWLL